MTGRLSDEKEGIFRRGEMVVLYIRHSDDEDGGQTHRHDHRISKRGAKMALETAKSLVKRYGRPDLVFISPLRRGKETMDAMLPALDSEVKIYTDTALSRYFSRREQESPSVFPDTVKEEIPIFETWNDFKARVREHRRRMAKDGHYSAGRVVWCITHVLVLKQVALRYSIPLPEHVPFMYYFEADGHRRRSSQKEAVRRRPKESEERRPRTKKKMENVSSDFSDLRKKKEKKKRGKARP